MFEYLKGKLVEKQPEKLVLEVNGVGYAVHIPLSTYERLPDVNDNLKIRTYLHVKDDGLVLYGFSSKDELTLFLSLISVSKVGPKLALNVLSFISINQFKEAIEQKDVKRLTRISGIGKKTAQRIILELAGKLVFEEDRVVSGESRESTVLENAINGLMSLGLSRTEAYNAIKQTGIEIDSETRVEELIKLALKRLKAK